MQLYWSSNAGITRQLIPASAFSYSAPATLTSTVAGLSYSYFEGTWSSMPSLSSLSPVKTGNTASIDLAVRGRDINYAILWQGYITIPANGTYTFETNSDDGSMLYIGQSSSPLVNNDGLHSDQLRSGSLYLAAGVYPFSASFFQNGGGQTMQLYWSSNAGITRQLIPAAAFSYSAPATPNTAGLSYSYFEGSWSALPNFAALSPLKTGTTPNIDILTTRNTTDNYAFMWQGFINIPSAGSYTFETLSDDGSKFYFNSPAYSASAQALVSNDGLHSATSVSGSITIPAPGLYPITVTFFEKDGGEAMQLLWTGPGISRQAVPNSALSTTATNNNNTITTPPSTETGGITGATNYYFSSSMGNDAYSASQAQNQATPWKSVAKMNALLATATPGTTLLLKRGDSFDGALYFGTSGTSGNPISLSAYGTGAKPVINGFAAPAWTAAANGIWEAPLTTSISYMNMVAKGAQTQPMGRYPNITEPGMGFLSLDAHSNASADRNSVSALYSYLTTDGSTSIQSITDYQLPTSTNWTGAELVIKKNRWVIDRGLITNQNGQTLYYVEPSGMQTIDGFGYFIQNDPRTLDQAGEWYFNPATKKIQVYSGSSSPATLNIRPSVIDTLVTIRSRSFITLDNIALQGANAIAIAVWDNADNVSVQNCSIDFSGNTAIRANYLTNFSLTNSVVNHTNNNALYLAPGCWNASVKGNTIKNAGIIPGLGQSNNQTHEGIIIGGTGSIIQYNTLDSIGYVGIAITRDSVTVANNLVTNFAMITDDCGGIYTHDAGFYGRKIIGNIVLGGHGCHYGTNTTEDSDAQGIGLDDLSSFVEITGNTVANCSGKGIGLHNAQNIIISNNTAFNNKFAQLEFDHDVLGPNSPTRNVSVTGNILVSKTAAQPVLAIASKENDVALFGSSSGNYFCRPIDDKQTFVMMPYANTSDAYTRTYDLTHWTSTFSCDRGSRKSPLTLAPYMYGSMSANMVTNGSFDQNTAHMQTPTAYHTQLQYDGYGMDGGSVKVSFTGGSSSDAYQSVQFYDAATASLQSGHTYRIRFSVKAGSDNNTDFYCSLLSAYGDGRTGAQPFKISNSRTEVELLFTPAVNVSHPYFEIYSPVTTECPVFWLDNLQIQEVYQMSATNPDDYLRLEYNASQATRTISLDGVYVDMKGVVYNGSVTLAPYSSAVLMRSAGTGVAAAQSQAAAGSAKMELSEVAVSAMAVKLSPNPATDRIQLTHSLQLTGGRQTATLTIYNAAGAAVKMMSVELSQQVISIGIADLAHGVYTVKLDCAKASNTARFVKL